MGGGDGGFCSHRGSFHGGFVRVEFDPSSEHAAPAPHHQGRTCTETSLSPSLPQTQAYPDIFPACVSQMLFNATLPRTMPGRRWEQRREERGTVYLLLG